MLKTIRASFLTLVALLVPVVAFAQDAAEPVAEQDLTELVQFAVAAAQEGKWGVFAAAVTLVLVYFATKIKFVDDLLPKAAKPWVGAVAGVLAATAANVIATGDWLTAILEGFVTGAAAAGLWELVARKLSKGKSEGA